MKALIAIITSAGCAAFAALATLAVIACAPSAACAQTPNASLRAPAQQSLGAAESSDADSTLEIPPRIVAPPLAAEPAPAANESTAPDGAGNQQSPFVAPPSPKRPYLGIGVQYIFTHKPLGQVVEGLEVVSVDRGSPADRAGLRGRGAMTKIGASGATAGALVPPLEILMMPLLKKSGQLGTGGDLIVAIDDHRVERQDDLANALNQLKPGQTVYFTVVRPMADGTQETLKIPVKLGRPGEDAANASASARAAPGSNAAPSPAAAVNQPPRPH
ncbi:MAG: PDZ domain-containing protein [Candidatus Binataceae bacterium]